jgi:predicted nucleic acid-binding protein
VGSALTVLDAQALVAALTGEPAAAEVEGLLRDTESPARITTVNLGEVVDVLIRLHGLRNDTIIEKVQWLTVGGLVIDDVDDRVGLLAGGLRGRHYHRSKARLSAADCIALATALTAGERLATADPHLLKAAVAEGCPVQPLLDSRGQRASPA